jgi:hypothetical protein
MFEKTLNNLRERPKEERTTIAAWIAIGVVAILFVCWLIYFFNSIKNTPAPNFGSQVTQQAQNGIQEADQQIQQESGQTSQFVQSQGSLQLQQLSATTSSSY